MAAGPSPLRRLLVTHMTRKPGAAKESKDNQGQKLGPGHRGCATRGAGSRSSVSERETESRPWETGAGGGDASLAQPHTGSGSAVPQAHRSGCRDSRLTSGSRSSAQVAGRAEPCRRAAPRGRCRCRRPPGAGCPGPSSGPGHLCTHSAQSARSHRPAPGSLWGRQPSRAVLAPGSHLPSYHTMGPPPLTVRAAAARLAGLAVLTREPLLEV